MNYEILTGLLAVASGVFLTLCWQLHQKAAKAVKEAREAVASVGNLSDVVRTQQDTFARQIEANLKAQQTEADKRIQKLEIRLEDISNRLAAQQIKR